MDGELITHMKQFLVCYFPELTCLKYGGHQVEGVFLVLSNLFNYYSSLENLVCGFALKIQEKNFILMFCEIFFL